MSGVYKSKCVWLVYCGFIFLTAKQTVHGDGLEDLIGNLGWDEPGMGEEIFGPKQKVELPTCTKLKVGILDLGSLAHTRGMQPCSMALLGNHAELVTSLHSGPLHLIEAIQGSSHYTENIEEADIVFVNDYCYYATGAAFKSGNATFDDDAITAIGGQHMLEAYRELLKSSRWQRRLGGDFVFYDSHCGFGVNRTGIPLDEFVCTDFRNATLLTTDRALRNEMCRSRGVQPLPHNRVMTVPTVPHRVNSQRGDMHLKRQSMALEDRSIRINKRSLCPDNDAVPEGYNPDGASFTAEGTVMRQVLARVLADSDDGQVDCDQYEYLATQDRLSWGEGPVQHFDQTYSALERSVFCIFLPGVSGMGHRFSEAMMAGCIPVLIGPPFAPMPFLHELRYSAAMVILNVTNPDAWKQEPESAAVKEGGLKWSAGASDAMEPSILGKAIDVESVSDIRRILEEMPDADVERRLQQIADIRNSFAYDVELTEIPNAANHILSGICRRTGRGCSRSQLRREGESSSIQARCHQEEVAQMTSDQ